MKKLLTTIILAIICNCAYGQDAGAGEDTSDYIPKCILENYCNPKGLIAIKKCILLDDKASNIRIVSDDNTKLFGDSILYFNYAKNIIALECGLSDKLLGVFRVAFTNEIDMHNFGMDYMYEMELFDKDETEEGTRYFSKKSPMNAITLHNKPLYGTDNQPLYFATCFVFQWGFCR